MFNLANHFFQCQYAFVSYKELAKWCQKWGIVTSHEKKELLEALEQIGGKKAKIRWKGREPENAIMYIGLIDPALWDARECWGHGVTIQEI